MHFDLLEEDERLRPQANPFALQAGRVSVVSEHCYMVLCREQFDLAEIAPQCP